MLKWLFAGAGANKTTLAGIAGLLTGIGLYFNGQFDAGMLLILPVIQQVFIRWAKGGQTSVLVQRTFYASLGGVATGLGMVLSGSVGEGLTLVMLSVQAIFQRQGVAKKTL